MKTKILMLGFIAFLFASCNKKDATEPSTDSGFKPKYMEVQFPGYKQIWIFEYDDDLRIIKNTTKPLNDTTSKIHYTTYSYTTDAVYSVSYDENDNVTSKDTLNLISGRVPSFYSDTIIYNSNGFIEKLFFTDSTYMKANYNGDNMISESYFYNGIEEPALSYEFYTNKEDKYRLNSLLTEDDGIMGRQIFAPIVGKSSKNLLKKINWIQDGEVYNISYDFDSNGFPKKILFESAGDTGSVNVIFK